MERWLKSCHFEYSFFPYKMKNNLKQGTDPLVSWHAILDKNKITTNGLGLILRGYCLAIYKKHSRLKLKI